MAKLERSCVILLVVLLLFLFGRDGSAQQEQPVDPWQFPNKIIESNPFQRWWWAFKQRAYPLDDVPEDAKLRALDQIEQFKARQSLTSQPPTSQPVQGGSWVNIGPAPIAGTFFGASSGRVAAVAVHPSDTSHWLIGAAQGGVWQTLDAGATWVPLTDAQASTAMGAITFAPSNPNIIYAGTGEAHFSGDSYAGAGLLKSTDGGATWQLLATSTFGQTAFSDIKVHPTNPDIVLAGTTRGIAGRVAVFPVSFPARGIFKSADGGVTFSQKFSGEATDLEVDPTNFLNQYAGIGDIFGSAANGVYRSTDSGETWTLISGPWSALTGGVGRVELAISPSNPNTLYVSIQDSFNGVGNDGELLGIWRTDNAWDGTPTWTQLPNPSGPGNQLWYDHEIIVDPTNSNIVYLGATPLFRFDGAVWSTVTDGIHVDQHSMAFAGSRLIVGNDGGVWSTVDGGSTWINHNTNLSITQFYDGSIHPTNPDFALGGSQDNGTEKWTGADAWQFIFGADGADNAISSNNPDTNWAVSFQFLAILRTTNGGASFSFADSGIDKTGAPFIARFEKCPANDDVFIAGTDNIWRSSNFFSAVSPSWSDNLSGNFGSGISALAFAPSDATCNTYAFGTNAGSLRLTMNGGVTWTDIDAGNAVPNRAVTDLAFDPSNANILYVTLSGFDEGTAGQPGHVFKSTNALSPSPTWSNVSPPVNIPHNTIAVDSIDPNIVYVGTDLGVWKSTTGGVTWTHMGPETGMPNVAVFELQINNNTGKIVAFTHGRGAFALTSGNEVFVRQQYLDFLDREPDSGGFTAWVNALDGGLPRASLIEAFMNSLEFELKGKFIAQAYLGILVRDADYGGFRAWLGALLTGVSREQIVQGFLSSGEFQANFGSSLANGQFVERMYNNVLLRSSDSGGFNFWVGQLNSGQMTRAQVALSFLDSAEFQNLSASQNRVTISLLYFDMLRRNPDAGGFSANVGALNTGVPLTSVIDGFLNSAEYQARF